MFVYKNFVLTKCDKLKSQKLYIKLAIIIAKEKLIEKSYI